MRKRRQFPHAEVTVQPPLSPCGCGFCGLDAAVVITIRGRSFPLCDIHFSALRTAVVGYRGENVKDSCLDKNGEAGPK